MIGTPRAEMHRAGAIRSRSPDHAAYTLGVPVRLYVHLTWTTLQRQPLINHGVADFLRRFLPREAKRHGAGFSRRASWRITSTWFCNFLLSRTSLGLSRD